MLLWQKLKRNLYAQYILMFAIVALCIFAVVPLTGSSLVWNADGITQHYPALLTWRKMLRELIFQHHLWAQWSWNLGLGSDALQTFSYYTMGDIFTYPAIFFQQNQMVAYYSIMVVVRLFFMGWAFLFAAQRLAPRSSHLALLTGTVVYMFSGYTAYVTFAHPFFLNPLIILPLLIYGLHRALEQHKFGLLIAMVAWALFNNFYFGIMLALGTIIYWVILLSTHKEYRKFTSNLKVIGATILGTALSAALFLPSIVQLFNSARSSTKFANGLTVYPYTYYLTLPGLSISNANRPYWVTGAIMVIGMMAVVWTVKRWRTNRTLAVTLLVSLLIMLLPGLAALMNGGSSPSNRWTLMLALPIAIAVVRMIDQIHELTRHDFYWMIGYGLVAMLSLFAADDFAFTYDLGGVAMIYIVVLTLLILIRARTWHPQRLLVVLLTLTMFNAVMIMRDKHANQYSVDNTTLMSSEQVHELTTAQQAFTDTATAFKHRSSIDDQLADYAGISPADNLPILAKTYNINSYWSLQNKYLSQLSASLENNTSDPNDVIKTGDYRNSLLLLLGVKNLFMNSDNNFSPWNYDTTGKLVNGQHEYTATTVMPLIYQSTGTMSLSHYQSLTPSEREVALLNNTVMSGTTTRADNQLLNKVTDIKLFSLPQTMAKTQHVTITTPSTNYQPTLYTLKLPKSVSGYELHVRLTHIHYTAGSLSQRAKAAYNNYVQQNSYDLMHQTSNTNLRYNPQLFKVNWLRKEFLNSDTTTGQAGDFTIAASYRSITNTFTQVGSDNLSFYNPRTATTLNLGTISRSAQFMKLQLTTPGTYSFDVSAQAVPVGKTVTQAIDSNTPATNIKATKNRVTATFTAKKSTTLATTIPYASGWQLHGTNGKLPLVNQAFIGIPVHKGINHIVLTYSTPFANVGIWISIAAGIVVVIGGTTIVMKRRKETK